MTLEFVAGNEFQAGDFGFIKLISSLDWCI